MRVLVVAGLAVMGIAVAIVSNAIASQPAPSTIEGCAALLPPGKTYTFEIAGSIDTTGPAPKLSGEMTVSDGTEQESAETAAFGQCMAGLIRATS